jgi:hypothetical protein
VVPVDDRVPRILIRRPVRRQRAIFGRGDLARLDAHLPLVLAHALLDHAAKPWPLLAVGLLRAAREAHQDGSVVRVRVVIIRAESTPDNLVFLPDSLVS